MTFAFRDASRPDNGDISGDPVALREITDRFVMLIAEGFVRWLEVGELAGPVAEADIARAEDELGVVFSAEYRELLRTYGAVVGDGFEIYGLPPAEEDDGPPLWRDVVKVTKKLRAMQQAGSERQGFVPISADGSGIYFYLDTSAAPATKIFAIGPGVEQTFDVSLPQFFVDYAAGRIAF